MITNENNFVIHGNRLKNDPILVWNTVSVPL